MALGQSALLENVEMLRTPGTLNAPLWCDLVHPIVLTLT